MNNGNGLLWICLLLFAGGAGWLGFRLATDSAAGTHDGALEIESGAGRGRTPEAGPGGGAEESVRPIVTVGPVIAPRAVAKAAQSTALGAFSADAEARPLRGSVRNPDGDPVAGARVALRAVLSRRADRGTVGDVIGSTLTDEAGGFSLEGFARLGERYALDVTHEEFARLRVNMIDPLRPSTMTQDVVLQTGVAVSGTVTDAGGKGLGGADVTVYDLALQPLSNDGFEEGRATTDADGNYEVGRLCVGIKRVVARSPGLASVQKSPLRLRSTMDRIDFRLSPGRHIAGSVIDDDTREGVANATVRAAAVGHSAPQVRHRGSSAQLRPAASRVSEVFRTGANGRFRLEGLAPGLYVVTIVDGPGKGSSVNAKVGDEDVVLTARVPGVVSGRVLDADTGAPVTRFSAALMRGENSVEVPPGKMTRVSDEVGAFRLVGAVSGRHHVVVTAPGYARGMSAAIETSLGERVSGVTVRLERGIVLHGRVVDAAGEAISSADVAMVEEVKVLASRTHPSIAPQRRVDAVRRNVKSFADGSFLMPNQSRGRFHLVVDHPDFVRVRTDSFDLVGNGAAGVIELSDVVLASGAIVSGVVMDENGRPDYLAVVTAIPDGQTTRRALIRPAATDGEGRYRLSGLGAGRWRIAVTQRRGRMARSVISTDTQTIDLSAGERRQVHFRNP